MKHSPANDHAGKLSKTDPDAHAPTAGAISGRIGENGAAADFHSPECEPRGLAAGESHPGLSHPKDNAAPSVCCASRRLFPKFPSSRAERAERSCATLPAGTDSSNGATTSPPSSGSLPTIDPTLSQPWRVMANQGLADLSRHANDPTADGRTQVRQLRQLAGCIEAELDRPPGMTPEEAGLILSLAGYSI